MSCDWMASLNNAVTQKKVIERPHVLKEKGRYSNAPSSCLSWTMIMETVLCEVHDRSDVGKQD
jgi:hypothetical protein